MQTLFILTPLLLPLLLTVHAQEPPAGTEEALLGFDPVVLADTGREELGDEEISVMRKGFWYLFVSAENRDRFLRDPERYEIQLDGLCARMGGGSRGDPEVFAVHQGRIFILRSDQCLEAFLEEPHAYLPPAPKDYSITAEARAKGARLIKKVQTWLGGQAGLDTARRTRLRGTLTVTERNGELLIPVIHSFDSGHFLEERQNPRGTVKTYLGPEAGFWAGPWGVFDMNDAQRRGMNRSLDWRLLPLLHSLGGLREAVLYESSPGESAVLLVTAFEEPAILRVHSATGRLESLSYTGRGPDGRYGRIIRRYSDYRKVDGFQLPFAVGTTWKDEVWEGETLKISEIQINPVFSPDVFKKPEGN